MDKRFPSLSLTRLALIVAVPLAVTVTASASISVRTWMAGDTLTAADLNASFKSIKDALVVERVSSSIATANNGDVITATAACPTGKTVLGGGCIFDTVSDSGGIVPLESYPNTPTTFTCKVFNTTGGMRSAQAFAICAGLD